MLQSEYDITLSNIHTTEMFEQTLHLLRKYKQHICGEDNEHLVILRKCAICFKDVKEIENDKHI